MRKQVNSLLARRVMRKVSRQGIQEHPVPQAWADAGRPVVRPQRLRLSSQQFGSVPWYQATVPPAGKTRRQDHSSSGITGSRIWVGLVTSWNTLCVAGTDLVSISFLPPVLRFLEKIGK